MKEMELTKSDDKRFHETDDKPKRILHVFSWFDQGGIENLVMNIYRNIDRSKIQFDFAFPIRKKGYFDDEAISLGANIYLFDSEKISIWNYFRSLKRIIKEHGPFVAVHSHQYYFSGIILLIAKLCGVKIRISHSHETKKGRKESLARKIYEKSMRKLIQRNATDWLSCSDIAGEVVFGKNIPYKVLYNGIDLDRFTYREEARKRIREDLGIKTNKVILNVGRFTEQKNHEFIIDIFNELVKLSDDYRLVMIGSGPLEEKIRNKCKEYDILDKCIFLKNIQNAEDYYCAADIFLFPSLYEGMGIVTIEAQATGLTSVLSKEVPKEVGVTDLAHYIDLHDSAKEWANSINKLSINRVDRSAYNNLLRGSEFDIKTTIKNLTNLYLNGE